MLVDNQRQKDYVWLVYFPERWLIRLIHHHNLRHSRLSTERCFQSQYQPHLIMEKGILKFSLLNIFFYKNGILSNWRTRWNVSAFEFQFSMKQKYPRLKNRCSFIQNLKSFPHPETELELQISSFLFLCSIFPSGFCILFEVQSPAKGWNVLSPPNHYDYCWRCCLWPLVGKFGFSWWKKKSPNDKRSHSRKRKNKQWMNGNLFEAKFEKSNFVLDVVHHYVIPTEPAAAS